MGEGDLLEEVRDRLEGGYRRCAEAEKGSWCLPREKSSLLERSGARERPPKPTSSDLAAAAWKQLEQSDVLSAGTMLTSSGEVVHLVRP